MGRTRNRVTVLVLCLEFIGLIMLLSAIYLAGALRLDCIRSPGQFGAIECTASEHRFFGLLQLQTRQYLEVTGAFSEPPAVGRIDHWVGLETADGRVQVLGSLTQERAVEDAQALQELVAGSRERVTLSRSAAPLALAAAVFGCLWILIISLIMREFLGYHTPWWWWRALKRQG